MITCYTKSTKIVEEKSTAGIISGHAYSILDVRDIVNANSVAARVVQIRNPWGKFEWNGEYSDDSNLWTPQLRKDLNIVRKDDGIFWMKIEDFLSHFVQVGILKIIPGYVSNAINVTDGEIAAIRIQVHQPTHITLGIDQLDPRTVDNTEYSYSYFRINR